MITFQRNLTKVKAELEELKTTHSATLTELNELKTKFTELESKYNGVTNVEDITKLKADHDELIKTHKDLSVQYQQMETELNTLREKQADFDKAVADKSMEITASQGIPTIAINRDQPGDEDLLSKLSSLPAGERFAFFQKNSEKIKAELVKNKK